MAKLLFKLNQVPEDEAADVRALLDEQGFVTYETQAGFWGLGVPAIWLRDDEQLPDAKRLLAQYQEQRREEQRQLYAEREANGDVPTVVDRAVAHPIRFVLLLIAVVVVLGFSILPFVAMIGQ